MGRIAVKILNGKKLCSKCKEEKTISNFYPDKTLKCGYSSWCNTCKTPVKTSWRKKQPPTSKTQKEYYRKCILKRKYGLTENEYNILLEDQDHSCAICKSSFSSFKPYVDHCHHTGIVRGLLCINCNTGLGHFKDKPKLLNLAIQYLQLNLQNQ